MTSSLTHTDRAEPAETDAQPEPPGPPPPPDRPSAAVG